MPTRTHRSNTLLLTLALLVALLSSCNRNGDSSSSPEPDKRHVIAVVYPLADIVRQESDGRVQVEWFCENGLDPRDLRLTDAQTQMGRRADLIITTGFRDLWAGDMLDAKQQQLHLLRPEGTPTGAKSPDPHGALWLDPRVFRELIDEIRERLTVFDVKHEQEYRAAAAELSAQVDAFEIECRRRLAPFAGRKFVSLRPTWGPLVEQFGLTEIAPLDVEPRNLTDDQVTILKQAAKDAGTDLLVIDAAFLPGVQRELHLRTGLRLLPLDPLGSSAPDGHSTWIKLMRYNLEELEKGLK